jgi:hypothetical protein
VSGGSCLNQGSERLCGTIVNLQVHTFVDACLKCSCHGTDLANAHGVLARSRNYACAAASFHNLFLRLVYEVSPRSQCRLLLMLAMLLDVITWPSPGAESHDW